MKKLIVLAALTLSACAAQTASQPADSPEVAAWKKRADGITIILTAGAGGGIGSVSIGGSTDVQFPAPSGAEAGIWRGVAIYQDRNAVLGNAASLAGSAALKISGAIYLPSALINYAGTTDLPAGKSCVQIIGHVVEVQGNSRLSLFDCPTMGVRAIEASTGRPLLTCNQTILWAALGRRGVHIEGKGLGRLFQHQSAQQVVV